MPQDRRGYWKLRATCLDHLMSKLRLKHMLLAAFTQPKRKGLRLSFLLEPSISSSCRVIPRDGTLNLAPLPLRRQTIPLSALTRLSMLQQRPPWALRAASAIDNTLEPIVDQFGVFRELRSAAVSPVLRDGTRAVPRPMDTPIMSRNALDEAICSFRQSPQLLLL